jgi:hypothetical protein
VFRVSTVWWFYKRAKPFPSSLVFLEFLVLRVASIVYWDFLDAHSGHYTATIYIRFHYFFVIHFQFYKNFTFCASCWKPQISFEFLSCYCCQSRRVFVLLLLEGTNVGTGGSLCFTLLPTNSGDLLSRFQRLSLPFSFCLSVFLSWTYRAKKQTRCNVVFARATALWPAALPGIVAAALLRVVLLGIAATTS